MRGVIGLIRLWKCVKNSKDPPSKNEDGASGGPPEKRENQNNLRALSVVHQPRRALVESRPGVYSVFKNATRSSLSCSERLRLKRVL